MTSIQCPAGEMIGPVQAWKAACPREAKRTLIFHIAVSATVIIGIFVPFILSALVLLDVLNDELINETFIAGVILSPLMAIIAWIFMSWSYVSPSVKWAKRSHFDVTGFLKQNENEIKAKPKFKHALEFWVSYCLLSPKGKRDNLFLNLGRWIQRCATDISTLFLIRSLCLAKEEFLAGAVSSFQIPWIPICISVAIFVMSSILAFSGAAPFNGGRLLFIMSIYAQIPRVRDHFCFL